MVYDLLAMFYSAIYYNLRFHTAMIKVALVQAAATRTASARTARETIRRILHCAGRLSAHCSDEDSPYDPPLCRPMRSAHDCSWGVQTLKPLFCPDRATPPYARPNCITVMRVTGIVTNIRISTPSNAAYRFSGRMESVTPRCLFRR